jgi:hypothetical protein
MLWINLLSSSFNLELEAAGSSKVFVPINQTTLHHIREEHNPNVA